jgi:hypothetical protein
MPTSPGGSGFPTAATNFANDMTLSRTSVIAVAAWTLASTTQAAHAGNATISAPTRPPAVCFAPRTDREVVENYARAFGVGPTRGARGSAGVSVAASQYQDGSRWTSTATNGWGLGQGDPTTLTWSIVPDGTPISGAIGEPAAPSNLRAFLNGIYGSEAAWLPLFQQVFDRWAELTGVSYVYQPADDGVALFNSPGVLGVRGDVRIGGHTIDGNYNVLAYNYYPNIGDMVIDTGDSFFTNTSSNSLRLRNTLAHEHGHGLGLPHNCPINQTKLMEPTLSLAYDGPQHDDVLGANRAYGDDLEHNDLTSNSSDLGTLSNGTVTVQGISADDNADMDYFEFRVGAGKKATVVVTPVGSSYLQGPQNSNGSCSSGTTYDSRAQSDLAVELLDGDGQTVLGSASSQPIGEAETLANVALPSGAGTYFVRVVPGSANAAQLYQLGVTIADVVPPSDEIFSDGFDETTLSAWSASATGGGDLTTSPAAAMAGARGLAAVIDDTARLYVQDDTPNAEERYRVRFSFDPNGFTPGSDTKKIQILQGFTSDPKEKKLFALFVRQAAGGGYQLMAKVRQDGAGMTPTAWVALSDAEHAIELDWKKATAPGAGDGHLQIWLDGTSVASLTGLDNASFFVDRVRFGVPAVRASSWGTVYFDRFVSRRSSYIGP